MRSARSPPRARRVSDAAALLNDLPPVLAAIVMSCLHDGRADKVAAWHYYLSGQWHEFAPNTALVFAAENNLSDLAHAALSRCDQLRRGSIGHIQVAAVHGSLEVLQLAKLMGCPWRGPSIAMAAAAAGRLESLEWLLANGAACPYSLSESAARSSNLRMLQRLYAQHPPTTALAIAAAESGQCETLRWLLQQGAPCPDNICTHAVLSGRPEMLGVVTMLYEAGYRGCAQTSLAAAEVPYGLPTLKWLHAQGCPLPADRVSRIAAIEGRLNVMQWMHSEHIPIDPYAFDLAAATGHHALARWGAAVMGQRR
jgi:hypothetical protein